MTYSKLSESEMMPQETNVSNRVGYATAVNDLYNVMKKLDVPVEIRLPIYREMIKLEMEYKNMDSKNLYDLLEKMS